MTTPAQPPLGPWLLQRARDHGLTSYELSDLLGLPHHRLQRLKLVSDLDGLPLGAVRRLSHALNLTWPDWLEADDDLRPRPAPDTPDTTADRASRAFDDADRLHALLALVLGQSLTHQQIADVLDWPLHRVQTTLTHLAPTSRGMQLNLGDTTAELTIAPRALPVGARDRLQQLLLRQHGPGPALAYIAFRIGAHKTSDALEFARRRPDAIGTAKAAGLLTYSIGDDGHPIDLKLSPDVAFSLDIDTDLHDALLLDPP
ncbi:MAG TPA: hypothetical protein VFV66_21735 [Nonomuraea sp.]|nr:hypothetical protein [Nonomuraea sp.]